MKKLLLAAVTSAVVFTSVPTHDADAATKKTTYKKYKKYNSYNVASVARSIAANRVYVYGANNRYAVDCSAFAQQVMRAMGKSIPRTTYAQMAAGKRVYNPRPGDLVYFNGGSHVGVYIGNGRMVDALNPRAGVGERSIAGFYGTVTGYYRF
ncbi:NlpC/P60 family protein [Macrococcoides goetzii]|nr:C40 family peptidase [Macrococcus goetzii]TDM41622.1 NlpC/P60 family protein [Macrococcus goetzii]TDM50524.1 NlpC/P60 family protein [Macrococcus goetzii]